MANRFLLKNKNILSPKATHNKGHLPTDTRVQIEEKNESLFPNQY